MYVHVRDINFYPNYALFIYDMHGRELTRITSTVRPTIDFCLLGNHSSQLVSFANSIIVGVSVNVVENCSLQEYTNILN